MKADIEKWLEENHNLIFETTRTYIAIPSENIYPYGYEKEAQVAMERWMLQLGFDTDMFLPTDVAGIEQHAAYLNDGRNYESRPNLVGVLKGQGAGRSLLFSGHMDTVPVEQGLWDHDPFGGEIVDGKQYGVGSFDMKGGMLAAMLAVKCLQELGYATLGDLLIEFVVDEEFGGANGTLACRLRGYQADAAIIPEPTNLMICPANQGGAYYRITFRGRAGRSYSGESLVNPISAAGRFIRIIEQYHVWRNQVKAPHPLFDGKELPTLIQMLSSGYTGIDLGDRVPGMCSLDLWIQIYPGVTEEQILEEFTAFYQPLVAADEVLAAMPPVLEKKMRFLPGSSMDEGHPILSLLQQIGQEIVPDGLPYGGAPFACDSFMFNLHSSTPALILGPKGGNAHAANEFIYTADYLDLIKTYALAIAGWCGVKRIQGDEPV